MNTKDLNLLKERMVILAAKKGFISTFLFDKPYKYSSKEPLRWLFWLTEIQNWLRDNFNIYVQVESETKTSHLVKIKGLISRRTGDVTGEYVEALRTGIEIALNTLPDV